MRTNYSDKKDNDYSKSFESPKKSRKHLLESPGPKKCPADMDKDAPVQRLTFGPIPMQHLSDAKRANSPNSPKPIAPFDSPIKAVSKRRKQHKKMKKEIAEM